MVQINPYRILDGDEIGRLAEIAKRANTEEIGALVERLNRDMRLDVLFEGHDGQKGRISATTEKAATAVSKYIVLENTLRGREDWESSLSMYGGIGSKLIHFSSILFSIENFFGHGAISPETVRRYFLLSDLNVNQIEADILRRISKGERIPPEVPVEYLIRKGLADRTRSRTIEYRLTEEGHETLWLYEKLIGITSEHS